MKKTVKDVITYLINNDCFCKEAPFSKVKDGFITQINSFKDLDDADYFFRNEMLVTLTNGVIIPHPFKIDYKDTYNIPRVLYVPYPNSKGYKEISFSEYLEDEVLIAYNSKSLAIIAAISTGLYKVKDD